MNYLGHFVNSYIKQMFIDHLLFSDSALGSGELTVKKLAKISPSPPGAYYLVLAIVFSHGFQ